MTKRELFKQLKEKKLFSVYCIVIANSFYTENTARGYKDSYIQRSLDSINKDVQTIENYIHSVSTWPLNKYCKFEIKIQQ
jgi:hypothetical protein